MCADAAAGTNVASATTRLATPGARTRRDDKATTTILRAVCLMVCSCPAGAPGPARADTDSLARLGAGRKENRNACNLAMSGCM